MTLIGLYNYDHTLFDLLEMPDGIDKGLLIDSILMNGGEYEVIYPNPVLLKDLIGSWSRQWSNVFTNWLKVTNDMNEVAPLENYDRFEDWTDTNKHDSTTKDVGSSSNKTTDTRHGNDSFSGENHNTQNDNGNTVTQVSAFDSNGFQNKDKSDVTNTTTNNGNSSNQTITNSNGSSESNGSTTNDNTFNENSTGVHTGHIHGNIGVTTAAQMFQSFYDVMKTYGNIYESISYIFLQTFVMPIL